MSNPRGISATLTIDPAALAAFAQPMPANVADLLADVKALLADVRDRMDDAGLIAVDGDEAARRLSISRRTLQDLKELPSFTIGTRRLWRVADLLAYTERQRQGA